MKTIHIHVTNQEYEWFKTQAERQKMAIAEVIEGMIREAFLYKRKELLHKPSEELKNFLKKRLKEFPAVKEGYIRTKDEYIDIVIRLSEFSVNLIEQLASIEIEVNEKWPDLRFDVEYVTNEIIENNLTRFYAGE